MDKFLQKLTLVIPTYNEAANIENLCCLLVEVLSRNNIDFEVIIVDDNSPDQTWRIAQSSSGCQRGFCASPIFFISFSAGCAALRRAWLAQPRSTRR